jgi:hypothetical protein
MDLGNIVYILAIIAYFIYQATQSKKKKLKEQESNDLPEPTERPTSFEDLLKEIRGEQFTKLTKPTETADSKPAPMPQKPSRGYESTYEKPKSDSSYRKPESSYKVRPSTYVKPVSSYEKPTSSYKKNPTTYEKQKSWFDKNDDEISNYEGVYDEKVRARASDLTPMADIPSLEIELGKVKSKKLNPYAQLLRNPATVRDSIVLNEILTRKHF